jgi:hypothetical protein
VPTRIGIGDSIGYLSLAPDVGRYDLMDGSLIRAARAAPTLTPEGGVLNRRRYEPTEFDRARDELFSHIHRCGVLGAEESHQTEWLDDTLEFMADRYPGLTKGELGQLRDLGLRFCQPVIPHGTQPGNAETSVHEGASAA